MQPTNTSPFPNLPCLFTGIVSCKAVMFVLANCWLFWTEYHCSWYYNCKLFLCIIIKQKYETESGSCCDHNKFGRGLGGEGGCSLIAKMWLNSMKRVCRLLWCAKKPVHWYDNWLQKACGLWLQNVCGMLWLQKVSELLRLYKVCGVSPCHKTSMGCCDYKVCGLLQLQNSCRLLWLRKDSVAIITSSLCFAVMSQGQWGAVYAC